MVFANLQEKEKDAFFSLLDEYFQSRPEILAALSSSGQRGNNSNNPFNKAAVLAANSGNNLGQRALAAAPTAASSFKRNFGTSGGGGGSGGSTDPSTAQESQQDLHQPMAGRVAAAAAAFSQNQYQKSASTSSTTGGVPNKLSNVDTSSLKSVFANRAPTTQSFNKAAITPPSVVRTPPQSEPEPEDESGEGEWAEAMYDYVSDAPGDLNIRENQKIWVTERSSDDWWTGEIDGKSGLFPASYVKIL